MVVSYTIPFLFIILLCMINLINGEYWLNLPVESQKYKYIKAKIEPEIIKSFGDLNSIYINNIYGRRNGLDFYFWIQFTIPRDLEEKNYYAKYRVFPDSRKFKKEGSGFSAADLGISVSGKIWQSVNGQNFELASRALNTKSVGREFSVNSIYFSRKTGSPYTYYWVKFTKGNLEKTRYYEWDEQYKEMRTITKEEAGLPINAEILL